MIRRMRTSPCFAVAGALLALSSCSTVPETGRHQLTLGLTDDQMAQMGVQAYAEETSKYREIKGTPEAQMVQKVGRAIATASGRDYQWEFKLLDAPDVVNAFCLPGGKIAVYSGLLPLTQNESGLATVIGHEVAHATSGHGKERMAQEEGAGVLLSAIEAGLSGWSSASAETKGMIMSAVGAGAQYGVLLPYSREHESEADEIGLRFMVRAGYDPNEAPKLWDRMAQLGDAGGPEFMSTHPDPKNRAQRLRELIPKIVAEEKKK